MLIKKENKRTKAKGQDCTVWEYDLPGDNLGIAQAKINGRYPTKGKAVNTECDLIYMVISGNGVINTQQGIFELFEGDMFVLKKGTWYWVEANNLHIVLPSRPAWFPEQYKEM